MLVDFGLAQEYIAEKKSNNLKLLNSETQVVKRKRTDEVMYQLFTIVEEFSLKDVCC